MNGMRKGRGPTGLAGKASPDPLGYGLQLEYGGIQPVCQGIIGGTPVHPISSFPTLDYTVDDIGRLRRGLRPVTRPTVMGRRLNRELARCGSATLHLDEGVKYPHCSYEEGVTLLTLLVATHCTRMTKVSYFHTAHMCGTSMCILCFVFLTQYPTVSTLPTIEASVKRCTLTPHYSQSSCPCATSIPFCTCGWCVMLTNFNCWHLPGSNSHLMQVVDAI